MFAFPKPFSPIATRRVTALVANASLGLADWLAAPSSLTAVGGMTRLGDNPSSPGGFEWMWDDIRSPFWSDPPKSTIVAADDDDDDVGDDEELPDVGFDEDETSEDAFEGDFDDDFDDDFDEDFEDQLDEDYLPDELTEGETPKVNEAEEEEDDEELEDDF